MNTASALWLAVIASGIYHGLNPGMGWPLAVSAGLMDRQANALFAALVPLAIGHFVAMLAIILPFAFLVSLLEWRSVIQISAGLIVAAFGAFKLINRRHPRALARIRPAQLGLWSFAVAMAHGAGLMLIPIYLGLCSSDPEPGHAAAQTLIGGNLNMALIVSSVHTVAMVSSGGILAWASYRYLGLQLVSRTWINLEAVWALSLILAGGLGILAGSWSGNI
jgi:hypothetical protein